MKVRNYTFDAQSNPTTMFCSDYSRDKFNLDPPYQRGPVWGEERKRNLIRSLYMGLPVGAMFINRRRYPDVWTVIDGKQRILAVRDFVDEKFTIPGEWFGPEYELHPDNNYYWSELGQLAQRVFENGTQIAVYYTDFGGEDVLEREAELFELINFGGVPQGESDQEGKGNG